MNATRRAARRERTARRTRTSGSWLASHLSGLRRTLATVPRTAWVCALLAVLNAVCWSLITPPFLALDEPDHFAYVQLLAEAGRLPSSSENEYSEEENVALEDLHHAQVRFRPAGKPIFFLFQQEKLENDLAQPLSRAGPGGVGVAASEPPLYYALATIPYAIGSSGSILDRLELIRLLSAALAGVTALFVFLFLREALPRIRWAWTVGGLGVALGPLLGFSSSTVNPDSLLIAISAVVFFCLARAFRRGLTWRSAILVGVLIAAGLLTKLNFAGLAPGVAVGLILLTRREAKRSGPSAYYRLLAPALAIAVSPGVVYGLVNVLSNHHTFGLVSGGAAGIVSAQRSISGALSYIWQFYLPRLPWMHNDFSGVSSTRQIWFRNVIGLYGWGDTAFPNWVYDFALIPFFAIIALCARSLVLSRAALRARMSELFTYALMSLGLLTLIGASGYLSFPASAAEFTDARYLLPLAVLWAAILALAARGAGRRWGPAVGALIVVLVIGHDIFSQLQVIARYYG
jgi:4-amino-4-deoxy-L-arabinose transferase-like glycosyltransferase